MKDEVWLLSPALKERLGARSQLSQRKQGGPDVPKSAASSPIKAPPLEECILRGNVLTSASESVT